MDSRIRLLTLAAIFPMLVLIAWMALWLYDSFNPPVVALPVTPTLRSATVLPTYTPTPTDTPVVVVFPTVPQPSPTPTKPPTATPTPTSTATPQPTATSTRVPVRPPTATPAPTNTPEGGQYPFKVEAGPTLVSDRSCVSQNIVFGWIKARDGSGLPNMRLRLFPKYGNAPELPAITRGGAEAGYYELTLGASANEWDIYIADEADNQISPQVRFTLLQVESGQCWWQLNWIQR